LKTVHQLAPSAVPGDAVTGQAFAWRSLLRLWGYDGEVLTEHVHPAYRRRAFKLRPRDALARRADVLIVHYSLWSSAAQVALASDAEVALCYHNITPGDLLRPYNPRVADLCDRGRSALRLFKGRCSAVIADSRFNAAELERAGVAGARVVPLVLPLPRQPEPASPARASVILSVGRIAPNKRLEDLIGAFARYQRDREPGASLVLVGSSVGFEDYEAELRGLVERTGAEHVTFTGRVARLSRDAWYRRATVYASTSVHEGFCAPLVEALAHGLPVVARDAGAVAETLDGAGIVLPTSEPVTFAGALHEAGASASTRATLAKASARRLAELAPELVAERLRAALEPVLA
jgi:L-malate glycosyltransferase